MNWKKERIAVGICNAAGTLVQWEAPESGWLKLNVNASLFNEAISFTIGMVPRDERNTFICGKNMRLSGRDSVMQAEGVGALEALKWMEELGRHHILVEVIRCRWWMLSIITVN